MLLSDGEILALLKRGTLSIEPFIEKNLTPDGCDLTVGELYLPETGERFTKGSASIRPGGWFAVATAEYVRLPPDIAGQMWLRSSFARNGILSSFGMIDAGFEGNLTVPGFNCSHRGVEIPVGERFLQAVFLRMGRPAKKPYAARSGRYQGQRGVTLVPPPRRKG